MIAVALRSMAQRKLRSALTAVAILLGVAMIAGTYVQTDQIRTAMSDITHTANSGVDAEMTPRTAFRSTFGANDLIDQRVVARASHIAGAADVQGELFQTGSLVVGGRTVEPKFAPAIVVSATRAPFDPLRNVSGRLPGQRGEVLVNRKLAQDEHLTVGQRVGVTTRTGIQRVRLVGIADYGKVASIGGATLIVAPMADVQAWYGLAGKVSRVVASAAPGVAPAELVARLRRTFPRSIEIRTGEQAAAEDAKTASDSIGGFLTPALLAFSGAALLVGAFIIFNTFSISVAQRRREFALLRSIGATRRQVLTAVAAEALVLGVTASVLGLLCGLGFARGMGALFDAAGWGIPRGGMQLAARTIVIGLSVGIGVTLVAALVPAARATRVPPVAAMRDEALAEAPPSSRRAGSPPRWWVSQDWRSWSEACSGTAPPAAGSPQWSSARCSCSSAWHSAPATSCARWPRSSAGRCSAWGTPPASSPARTRRAIRRAPRSPRRRSWSGLRSWSSSRSSPPA
jgi:putative ABC transport system permease protein